MTHLFKTLSLILAVFILFTACNTSEKRFVLQGEAQGTTFTLLYFAEKELENLDKGVFTILSDIDKGLSTYKQDSYISEWNRGLIKDTLDVYFKNMYLISKDVHQVTEGYFDPTVQPLSQYYGFEKKDNVLPEDIDSILDFVGFNKLQLKGNRIEKSIPELKLNYNAIAQGYTVDVIVEYLNSINIHDFIFELGGEVYCSGLKPGNKKWIIGVDKPQKERDGTFQSELHISNLSVTTSGNYRKWKANPEGGEKFTHTINPHTGESSASDLLSVTVIHESCAKADAYSTALLSMKYQKAKMFLKQHDLKVMLIIDKHGETEVEYFNGFDKYIKE